MSSGNTDTEVYQKAASLVQYKKLEVSLTIGALAFIVVLFGMPELLTLLIATAVGLVSGVICFIVISFTLRKIEIQHLNHKKEVRESGQMDSISATISIHSPSNYEITPDKRVGNQRTGPLTTKAWTSYLIEAIEWRVFDRLCVAYWRIKENNISGIAERAQDGIDFFISAPKHKHLRIGVVQTRSSQSATPNIDDIRALIKLKTNNELPVAILMYAGRLSQVTHSYCLRNGVHLINAKNISKGLQTLSKREQHQLMKSLIRPDYMIPSCPACLIKLVKRQKKHTGKLFWGCISYPVCRFTMDHV